MNKIMLDNREIYYQVFFKKNKNMYLRIKSNQVIITAPMHFTIAEIERFIKKHQHFVLKHLSATRIDLYQKEEFWLWGKKHDIVFHDGKSLYIDGSSVFIPNNDLYEQRELFYRKETVSKAIDLIETELKNLIKEIDFSGIRLSSRLMTSRLGSCHATKKSINLNSILSRFDPIYLRAVLIHELVHLNISNHQKKFYNLLLKYVPNYRAIRKELGQIIKTIKI
ncbi:MAG: DUF45 domain-containing protein [Candidatus Izemoplasmatales bacterium]|jgi:predicted metal-dependent hydrolase|nr:DUF45 domain-containing protein [Candidatus Izemoplasmatales bacterium]